MGEFTEYVRKGMYEYLSRDERVNETLERLKKRCAASASKKGKMVLMTNTAEKQARKCLDALEIDEKLFETEFSGVLSWATARNQCRRRLRWYAEISEFHQKSASCLKIRSKT